MISRYVLTFLACAALSCGGYAQNPRTHQHSFGDAQKWAQVFDDPRRDEWQKPHDVIRALALRPDGIVADVGAGTGYFAVRLAHVVPKGRVYAVDTEPEMVKHLAERAKSTGLHNLIAIKGEPQDPRIPEPADIVLFVDVYHHVEQREGYFRKLASMLKPSGRLAIIDFKPEASMGPPRAMRIASSQVRAELKSAGYDAVEEHSFLPNQYFLVFARAKQ